MSMLPLNTRIVGVLLLSLAVVAKGQDASLAKTNTAPVTRDITLKLIIPGVSGLRHPNIPAHRVAFDPKKCVVESVPAKEFDYTVKSGRRKGEVYSFAAVTNPCSQKINIVPTSPPPNRTPEYFYVANKSGITMYYLRGGSFRYNEGFFEVPVTMGGLDMAIARFGAEFDERKLYEQDEWGSDIAINIWSAVHTSFFGGKGEGSNIVDVTVRAFEVTDETLHLNLLCDGGDYSADIWIDLKTKKVISSVENGQVMDISGREGKPLKLK